jgi:hypothetical protein
MASVRMYTFYKDLPLDESADKLKEIQFERDSKLFTLYKNQNIPLFPMSITEFRSVIPKLVTLSKMYRDDLCMAFVINPKTCHIINNGEFSSYETLKDAQIKIMNADEKKLINIINKYDLV